MRLYEAVIKDSDVLDEAKEGAMNTLTLRLVSMEESCTMCTERDWRETEGSSGGECQARAIKKLEVEGLGTSFFFSSLALAPFLVLDRNCLKRSGAKRKSSMARQFRTLEGVACYHHTFDHVESAHELQRSAPYRLQHCRIHGDRDENNCHFCDFTDTC